jgi:hypothetical protein
MFGFFIIVCLIGRTDNCNEFGLFYHVQKNKVYNSTLITRLGFCEDFNRPTKVGKFAGEISKKRTSKVSFAQKIT